MRHFILILAALFILEKSSINGQTNINIYNSKVTIVNNITISTNSNSIKTQPTITKTNKLVILPRYYMERLQWENMLEDRRRATFKSYLRKYDK